MDKEIYRHRDYMTSELKRIAKIDNKEHRLMAYRELAKYHAKQTWNFQHERQIHLYVTIIFGVITLVSWALFFSWWLLIGNQVLIVTVLLFLLTLILTVLEGCYLGYYYRMENRTQTLYPIDKQLHQLIQDMLK